MRSPKPSQANAFIHPPTHPPTHSLVINEAIHAKTVRLVIKDESGGPSTSEVVSREDALMKAREAGLDLVLGKYIVTLHPEKDEG